MILLIVSVVTAYVSFRYYVFLKLSKGGRALQGKERAAGFVLYLMISLLTFEIGYRLVQRFF